MEYTEICDSVSNIHLKHVKAVGLTCAGESRYEAVRLNDSSGRHGDRQVLKLLWIIIVDARPG